MNDTSQGEIDTETPVNPYKYLRTTMAHIGGFAAGS